MSPVTRAGSSRSMLAIRPRVDAILPEPPLSPLVPEQPTQNQEAVMAFLEWAAFEEEAVDARAAKRLMESMGVR